MSRKIWIGSDGNLQPVDETPFSAENRIQSMFNDNPDVIPGEDFGLDQLMVVGRESTLGSGYPDLIAVTKAGDVIIVEFKNVGNAQARREVIGQLLDYGASLWKERNTCEAFDEQVAQRYFSSRYCQEKKLKNKPSLEAAAIDFFEFTARDEESEEDDVPDSANGQTLADFKDALGKNLSSGTYVYIIVCPEIPETARNIIEYTSLCTNMRFYGVELEYFRHQNLDIVFPKGIAFKSTPPPRPGKALMTAEDFERAFRARGEECWRAFEDFRQKVLTFGGHFKPYSKGMGAYFPLGDKRGASLLYIDTGECLLHVISGRRLDYYADERPDLGYFDGAAREAYKERIRKLDEKYRLSLDSTTWYSTHVPDVGIDEFRGFLNMILDFYRTEIQPKAKR